MQFVRKSLGRLVLLLLTLTASPAQCWPINDNDPDFVSKFADEREGALQTYESDGDINHYQLFLQAYAKAGDVESANLLCGLTKTGKLRFYDDNLPATYCSRMQAEARAYLQKRHRAIQINLAEIAKQAKQSQLDETARKRTGENPGDEVMITSSARFTCKQIMARSSLSEEQQQLAMPNCIDKQAKGIRDDLRKQQAEQDNEASQYLPH